MELKLLQEKWSKVISDKMKLKKLADLDFWVHLAWFPEVLKS